MPYWRLSGFYFFYFASLGALIPFWGLYLQDRGFTPLAIGELMAVFMATKIIAPNLWGWIADYTGSRLPIVRLASLLSMAVFGAIYAVEGFWGIALVMTLFSFFWNASLPQMEAVTFNHLGARIHHYAGIRLWGSVGFIIAVLALGAAVERAGTGVVPGMVLALFAGIWLSTLLVPDSTQPAEGQQPSSIVRILRIPEVAAFLATCFLMQASHGALLCLLLDLPDGRRLLERRGGRALGLGRGRGGHSVSCACTACWNASGPAWCCSPVWRWRCCAGC